MSPFTRSSRRWIVWAVLFVAAAGAAWPFLFREFRAYRGRAALRLRHGDEALSWLGPLAEAYPNRADFQFLLARACRRVGRLGQAEACLEKALQLGHPMQAVRREEILVLAHAGRMSLVEPALTELLVHPGEDGAEICEAFVAGYFLNYQMPAGLRIIEAWERDFPQDSQPHVFHGRYFQHIRAWKEASREYRRALELSPDAIEARRLYAQMLVELNEHSTAQKEFDLCLKHDPRDVAALIGRAHCLRVAGRDELARRDILAALGLAPGSAEALEVLGGIEREAGNTEAAIGHLREAAAREPHNIEIRYALAGALQAAGKRAAASEHFRYVDAARTAELKIQNAMELLLKRANDLGRNDELNLRFEIGSLTLAYGIPADAITWLQSVLELDPDYAPAHALLFEYYTGQGNEALAAQHRRKANRAEGQPHGT